jgi:hypothetical protein
MAFQMDALTKSRVPKIKQHLLLHLICHWLPCSNKNCYADSTHHQQHSRISFTQTWHPRQKTKTSTNKRQSETLTPFSLIPSLRKTSITYELTTNISAFFYLSKNWKKRTDTGHLLFLFPASPIRMCTFLVNNNLPSLQTCLTRVLVLSLHK